MPTILYNASVEGVAGLLPHRRIDATTEPSDAQVARMLEAMEGEVAAAISAVGAMPSFATLPDDLRDTFANAARGLVELGAAARAEAAAHPEDTGAGSYYATLQARYNAGLTSFPANVKQAAAVGVETGGPAQARSYPAVQRTLDAPWLASAPPSLLGPNPRRW